MQELYDVAIIGGGICGAAIGRELSKSTASVCILEKEDDVSCGTSKANSGIIHAGYDPEPGTLMARLNVRGASLYPDLAKKLHFDFKQIGSLVLAFDDKGCELLKNLYQRGIKNGVQDMSILDSRQAMSLEANLNPQVQAALFAKSAGIVSPYQATWALAESAVVNGLDFFRNTMVHAIEKENGLFHIHSSRGIIKSRFLVNAAGLNADKISSMAGARDFTIVQRRGEYCLLDSRCASLTSHVLFQTPGPLGKGVLVTQTVDGNILIGPSADSVSQDELGYTGTSAAAQKQILNQASLSVTEIPQRNIINSFAGIRAIAFQKDSQSGKLQAVNDFIIEEDSKVASFINVAGICSPGLTAAPAIGEEVVRILQKAGLRAKEKSNFIEERPGIPSFKNSSLQEKEELIKKDKRFGQIICRCEMITEGEIVAAIHSPLGAVDLDGVKRRTRAGMGRCQSGFCSPRVTEILSRELNIPMINVTKRGGSSYILDSKIRPSVNDIAGSPDKIQ